MPTIYLLGLGWANGCVLFESAHYLPAGYELGKLFQNPQLTHNVPTGYIALCPQWEVINVCCMPRAEFLAKIRELIQENALTRIHALLREMRSSVEAVVAGNELILNVELARVRSLQGAFAPIVVEGRLTPESVKGGHLTEASEGGLAEEGIDREETPL